MTVPGRHIIGKQFLELQYNGNTDGIALQKTTENILYKELLPHMEALFDRYGAGNEVICIDQVRLEIELDAKDLENNLSVKIINEMAGALARKIEQLGANRQPITETTAARFIKLLIFYLRNGYLPWWSSINGSAEWHAFVLANLSAELPAHNLFQLCLVMHEERVQQRIAVQFDEACFWELMKKMPGAAAAITNWQEDLRLLTTWLQRSDLQQLFLVNSRLTLLKLLAPSSVSGSYGYSYEEISRQFAEMVKTELEQLLAAPVFLKEAGSFPAIVSELKNNDLKNLFVINIQAETGHKNKISRPVPKKPPPPVHEEENTLPLVNHNTGETTAENPVYISNAGLVIVAPYLGVFFSPLGLVKENKVTDHTRAVALLQYIVTGENGVEEFETVLPKLLCGMSLYEPLKAKYSLTENEQDNVEELLQTIIANWPVLKTTSVAGLRQSFLQREGRLNYLQDHWHLKVQQLSYDMLLDQLPWNIKMIKLPWMTSLLTVEWN